jgi:hypothetical protein
MPISSGKNTYTFLIYIYIYIYTPNCYDWGQQLPTMSEETCKQ